MCVSVCVWACVCEPAVCDGDGNHFVVLMNIEHLLIGLQCVSIAVIRLVKTIEKVVQYIFL